MDWEVEVSSENRRSNDSEKTTVTEEVKELVCKRKRMDRGMKCIKTKKTQDCGAVVVVKNQTRGNKSSEGCRGSENPMEFIHFEGIQILFFFYSTYFGVKYVWKRP